MLLPEQVPSLHMQSLLSYIQSAPDIIPESCHLPQPSLYNVLAIQIPSHLYMRGSCVSQLLFSLSDSMKPLLSQLHLRLLRKPSVPSLLYSQYHFQAVWSEPAHLPADTRNSYKSYPGERSLLPRVRISVHHPAPNDLQPERLLLLTPCLLRLARSPLRSPDPDNLENIQYSMQPSALLPLHIHRLRSSPLQSVRTDTDRPQPV